MTLERTSMRNLLRNTYYLRMSAEQFSFLHVESGRLVSQPPLLAWRSVGHKRQPLAAGDAALAMAGQDGVSLGNGFQHPRTLLADFSIAETTLKLLLQQLAPRRWLQLPPVLILHPQTHLEGGLTQIEIRALAELALSAGAKRVYVWVGAALSPSSLARLEFPQNDGQLLYPEVRP
jgi:rod shape-determining protein MreB